MRFEILNVEHGFCAYVIARDGSALLFDCGHSPSCRPSAYLPEQGVRTIRRLFITNYDEDHISDLPNIRRTLDVEVLSRNASLTASQVHELKTPPISPAMESLLDMIQEYKGTITVELEPSGTQVWMFYNDYPTFTDTNNLSLLTFLDVGGVSFVLGGDLERAGWLRLLEQPQVRGLLRRANVFVASHHGRKSGYCREVFEICSPSLVVMSDGPIQHDTQRMADTYAQHASGEWFGGANGREWRKVVTTRKDGNLLWTPD